MNKTLSYIGFARKSGRLGFGAEGARNSVRSGKAKLVLVASDASARTLKTAGDMCAHFKVELLRLAADAKTLGSAIGKAPVAVVSIDDMGLAKAVKNQKEDFLWQ